MRVCVGLSLLALSLCAQTAEEPKRFGDPIPATLTSRVAVAHDGKTVYWVQFQTHILESHFRDGAWQPARPALFSGGAWRDGDPFLSPDGRRLFFWSNRPLNGKSRKMNAIWVVERTAAGWGEPRDVGENVNGPEGGTGFPSPVASGALYYFGGGADSLGSVDIYRARRTQDGYAKPENLGPAINSKEADLDAWVAPDESYMILTSARPGGLGAGDLYISTQKDGVWSAPRNLGPKINTSGSECCPAVSPDGQRFFFTSFTAGKHGISTIDAAALGLGPAPEKPVGDASLFEEGAVSTPGSFSITFSPDGRDAYFGESRGAIMFSRLEDGKWSAPAPVEFAGRAIDISPSVTPDGSRLLFASGRRPAGVKGSYTTLWESARTERGWGAPRPLPIELNGLEGADFPSVAANGTLYYVARREDSLGQTDIYRARRQGDGYAAPENLGPAINTAQRETDVYVAPDESYLVFASDRAGGAGATDLYISVRRDGAWTPARPLGGGVNTQAAEGCPGVFGDGRRLFFTRFGGAAPGVYQADARGLLQ